MLASSAIVKHGCGAVPSKSRKNKEKEEGSTGKSLEVGAMAGARPRTAGHVEENRACVL